MSVVKAREQARLYVGPLLREHGHHALPLPGLRGGALSICVLLCRAEILEPGAGLSLWPPAHAAWFSAADARLDRIVKVSPADFGRSDPPDQPLGQLASPADRVGDAYLTQLARTLQALDRLLDPFARSVPTSASEVAPDVATLRASLSEVLEPPLFPYYQSVGERFFAWLGFP